VITTTMVSAASWMVTAHSPDVQVWPSSLTSWKASAVTEPT